MTSASAVEKNHQRWVVVSIAFAAFMSKLDSSIVNISLPTVSRYFDVTPGEASWVILGYLLTQTTTMMIFGKLGDDIGLKRTFIGGYIIFTIGSVLCGLAGSLGTLIAFRCIQGLGGAMLITSAFAMVPRLLPRDVLGSAFGIIGTSAGLGVIVGAPVGGLLTGFLSWRWVFLINLPVGALAIFIAQKVIREKSGHEKDILRRLKEFDIVGMLASFAGLLALVYGLNTGEESGWASSSTITCLAAAVILLPLFLVWEKRHANPLLDLALFSSARFAFANVAAFMAFMLMSGSGFLMPFYLELTKNLETAQAGLVIMIFSVVYMVAGPFAGKLSDKMDPGILCALAMISAAACSLVFVFTLPNPGLVFAVIFLVWLALSFGLFISPNNSQAMKLAPRSEQGIAAGVFNTITSLGLVFGVTLFETIFSHSLPGRAAGAAIRSAPGPSLIAGFQDAYVLGGLVAFLAFVSSAMVRRSAGTGR